MRLFSSRTVALPTPSAVPGRERSIVIARPHLVLDTPIAPPFPEGFERVVVGMGCFWGAERLFWQAAGVYTTAVGYAGGFTPNPTYQEVCSGRTGHTEVVLVVFDPARSTYEELLQGLLGGPRPDPGHAPGQRRRHAVPLGDLLVTTRRSPSRRRALARHVPGRARAAGLRRHHHGDPPTPAPSTTPRTTTSSTWRRTPAGTAGSAAPA